MNTISISLLLCLLVSVSCVVDHSRDQWKSFKVAHKKSYKSPLEEVARFGIWKSNKQYIEQHNTEADNGTHTFWLRMNKFGDLTKQEFAKIYNGFNMKLKDHSIKAEQVFEYDPEVSVPDSVDWREKGYVTEVKDQGQCGSCWSFSSTGALEGQHFKTTGKLVSLSEQNLVDCSKHFGNDGCNGGLMDQAFQYIKANKGIDTEKSYPYMGVDEECHFDMKSIGATDSGFVDVKAKDEKALEQALATIGPVSVAIDAGHSSFQFYSHGVYYEKKCSQTDLDHGVLAVGYGTENSKDFWIVKNSWGPGWGDQGYIKMTRNKQNNCGIASSASYPKV